MAKKKGKKNSAPGAVNNGDKDDGTEQQSTPATSTFSSSSPAEEKAATPLSSSPPAEATPVSLQSSLPPSIPISEDVSKASGDTEIMLPSVPAQDAAGSVAVEEKEAATEEVAVSAQFSEATNSEPQQTASEEVASALEVPQPEVVPQSFENIKSAVVDDVSSSEPEKIEQDAAEPVVVEEELIVESEPEKRADVVPLSEPEKIERAAAEPVAVEEELIVESEPEKRESVTISSQPNAEEPKSAVAVPKSEEHPSLVAETEPSLVPQPETPATATSTAAAFVTPATEQPHVLVAPEKSLPTVEVAVSSKNSSFKKKSSIGLPRELHPEERVGLVPKHVKELCDLGMEVFVETDAGKSSGFLNQAYQEAGAEVTDDAARVWKSDLVVKMQPPSMRVLSKQHECNMVKKGGILVCNLRPKQNDDVTHRLALREGSVLAVDLLGPENSDSDIMKSSENFSEIAMSLVRDMIDDGKVVIGSQALVKKALVLHDGMHTWCPPQEPAEKNIIQPKPADIKHDVKPAPPIPQPQPAPPAPSIPQPQRAPPPAVSMATEKTPLISQAPPPTKSSSIFCCCCGD